MRDPIKNIFQNAGYGPSELNSGLPQYSGEKERAEHFFKALRGPRSVKNTRRRTARVFAVHTSEHLLMDEDDAGQRGISLPLVPHLMLMGKCRRGEDDG